MHGHMGLHVGGGKTHLNNEMETQTTNTIPAQRLSDNGNVDRDNLHSTQGKPL